MKDLSIALIAISALISSLKGKPAVIDNTVAASTSAMIYIGPTIPGGENVTLSGTAESIYNQIVKLNPTFNPNDFEGIRNAKANLASRTVTNGCCRCMGPPYNGEAGWNIDNTNDDDTIDGGVDYLMSLPGNCYTDSSGVARVSCAYNAAIFMVNSIQAAIGAPCWVLGSMANGVNVDCLQLIPNALGLQFGGSDIVNGQECDSTGFCTIVCSSSC